jgi:hypothetical protein
MIQYDLPEKYLKHMILRLRRLILYRFLLILFAEMTILYLDYRRATRRRISPTNVISTNSWEEKFLQSGDPAFL